MEQTPKQRTESRGAGVKGALAALAGRLSGRESVPWLLAGAFGALFAGTPLLWGAYPLGLALLCAAVQETPAVFVGLCLGAVLPWGGGFAYVVVYMVALLARLLLSVPPVRDKLPVRGEGYFGEPLQARVAVCLLVSLAAAAYEIAVSTLTQETLLFGIGTVVGSTVLCLVFWGLFSRGITADDLLGHAGARREGVRTKERLALEAGALALLFFGAYGLREAELFGMNLGYLFSAACSLWVARRFGALRGCAAGLVVGMAVDTLYSPAFGVLGLLCGALWPLGSFYSLCIGAASGIAWCAYVGGLSGFLGVAPEITVAALLSAPLMPRLYSSAIAEEVRQDRQAAEEAVEEYTDTCRDNTVERLAGALDGLGEMLGRQADTPDGESCFALCDEICTRYCASCPGRGGCWDSRERPASVALGLMAARLAAGQTFSVGDMPTPLISSCERLEALLGEVRLAGARLWREKGHGDGGAARGYRLMAGAMRRASERQRGETAANPQAAKKIRHLLAEKGLRPSAVRVQGRRRTRVVISSPELAGKKEALDALHPALEGACGCRLSAPVHEAQGGMTVALLESAPRYFLDVAFAAGTADGSGVSGDTLTTFSSPDGYFYLLVSDGMGSGALAARTSGTCTLYMERMLAAGADTEASLQLLNHLLTSRREECSATLDLLEFDTLRGGAAFLKSGAAASYIRREGNLFRLRSRTVPLGIVEEVDTERLEFDTQAGDVVVMVTDGVSQTSEDAPWLIEFLSGPLGGDLQGVANAILTRAKEQNGSRDDLTVVVARVHSA